MGENTQLAYSLGRFFEMENLWLFIASQQADAAFPLSHTNGLLFLVPYACLNSN